MAVPDYKKIFVPGGMPEVTYNPRTNKLLEERIAEAKSDFYKLVTITGQTKSGKTVLTQKIFPHEASAWINGGSVTTLDEFWAEVVDKLEYFQTEGIVTTNEESGASTRTDLKKGEFVGIGGSASYALSESDRKSTSLSKTKTTSNKTAGLKALEIAGTPLIIDDFHYIPRDIQASIVKAVKPLIFKGVPILLIAIPHRRYDAMKVEKEMTSRVALIEVPSWSVDELMFIPKEGFRKLNVSFEDRVLKELASEAVGSPHLMQEFCRMIAKEVFDNKTAPKDVDLKRIYRGIAENIGRPIFDKLIKGPSQRKDRLVRKLKSGVNTDIYGLILASLAHLKPGLISIGYEQLRQAVRETLAQDAQPPQKHEITKVLKAMSKIAATDESSAPVIDFDTDDQLHITDPFFSFYLKWGKLFDN